MRPSLLVLAAVVTTGIAPTPVPAAGALRLAWTNSMLTVSSPSLPGTNVQIWYIEAFCRGDSAHRDWRETTIPHKTTLVAASPAGDALRLRTLVEPDVEVLHDIRAGVDEVECRVELVNHGKALADVQWFQPCMRVDRFTGLKQSNYFERCFIFTKSGLTMLDQMRRTEKAIYRGGQVYAPAGISTNDVNPRPLSPEVPVNGLIGCSSADGRQLLATAWDRTQELFQGVIVCLHNDPRVGGLQPGERKKLRGKIYFLPNDPAALLERYRKDFAD